MIRTLLAYLLGGAFFAVERVLRRGEEAKSLEAGRADQGTTRLVGSAYGLALIAGVVLPVLRIGRVQWWSVSVLGIASMATGLALRVWAMRTLRGFYTRTLRVAGDQQFVQSGPYRLVRHPGYVAALLVWIGFGLTLANWALTLVTGAAMLVGYRRRMDAEEALLVDALGDRYRAYVRRTWRLVPGVY